MNCFWSTIQKNFSYTDLQIRRIQYSLKVIGGDISKLCMMLVVFSVLGKTKEYLTAVLVLLTLRSFSGGIHMKSYWSCFFFSLFIFSLSVFFLPLVPIPTGAASAVIASCGVITYLIGPIPSTKRPMISREVWQRFRIKTSLVLCMYFIFSIVLHNFRYLDIVVWTITVQTLQLIITNIIQKGERYECCTEQKLG